MNAGGTFETFAVDARIGFRNAVRQKRRSAFGISAVVFGVIALIVSGGFIEWIYWAAREGAVQAGLGHIQVMRPGYLERGAADPFKFLLPEGAPEQRLLEGLPGVRTVAPRLSFSGLISLRESTVSFLGEGVDPEREARFGYASIISKGEDLSVDDPTGVILGRGLADNLGAKIGDTIVLLTNMPSGGINAVEGRVRGMFTTVSQAYDDSALRVSIQVAQRLLRAQGAHRWIVVLERTELTDSKLAEIKTQLAGTGLQFVPWVDLADFYKKTVDLLSRQMGIVKLLIAAIMILCVTNSLVMNVTERTGEIGTSMALGARSRNVLTRFLSEGLTLGLAGSVVGAVIGVLLSLAISTIGIPMPPPPGMSEGYTGRILLTIPLVVGALGLAIATCVLASLYPAWKASRMIIVDALRHNR